MVDLKQHRSAKRYPHRDPEVYEHIHRTRPTLQRRGQTSGLALDEISQWIWSRIDGRTSIPGLVDDAIDSFGADNHESIAEDIEATLQSFVDHKLLAFSSFRFSIALIAVGKPYHDWCLASLNMLRERGHYDGLVHVFTDRRDVFDGLDKIALHRVSTHSHGLQAKTWKSQLLNRIPGEDLLYLDVDILCINRLKNFQSRLDERQAPGPLYLFQDPSRETGACHNGLFFIKREGNNLLENWQTPVIGKARRLDEDELRKTVPDRNFTLLPSDCLGSPEQAAVDHESPTVFIPLDSGRQARRVRRFDLRNCLVDRLGIHPVPRHLFYRIGLCCFSGLAAFYCRMTAQLPTTIPIDSTWIGKLLCPVDSNDKTPDDGEARYAFLVINHQTVVIVNHDEHGRPLAVINAYWEIPDFDGILGNSGAAVSRPIDRPEWLDTVRDVATRIAAQIGRESTLLRFIQRQSGIYLENIEDVQNQYTFSPWADLYLGLTWEYPGIMKNYPLRPGTFNKRNKWKKLNAIVNTITSNPPSLTNKDHQLVVCMTTIASRANILPEALDSLLGQTLPADRILIYISKEPHLLDEGIRKEPAYYDKYRDLGVEFIYCENRGQFRKTLESFKRFQGNPEVLCVYVDDDWRFPAHLLRKLYKAHRFFPDSVIGVAGKRVSYCDDGTLSNYYQWPLLPPGFHQSTFVNMLRGMLIPGLLMFDDYWDWNAIQTLSPTSDEVWINAYFNKHGISAFLIGDREFTGEYHGLTSHHDQRKLQYVNNNPQDPVRMKQRCLQNLSQYFSAEILARKKLLPRQP